MRIQEFVWQEEYYDCVLGVWCLCYLNSKDKSRIVSKMESALQYGGHMILIEPVLGKNENVLERYHVNTKQQMIIRTEATYRNLFKEFQMHVLHSERYDKIGCCNEELMAFVIKKELFI